MSESPVDAALPQVRDIVISRDTAEGAGWGIRGYQGPPALIAKTREQAVRLASAMARDMAVDVWLLEDGSYGILRRGRTRQGLVPDRRLPSAGSALQVLAARVQ